jgi:hypothetical protein
MVRLHKVGRTRPRERLTGLSRTGVSDLQAPEAVALA